MRWIAGIAFVVTILALAAAIWAPRQPQHFAFRVVDPGVAGTTCVAERRSPDEPMLYACTAPDYGVESLTLQEIPWPEHRE